MCRRREWKNLLGVWKQVGAQEEGDAGKTHDLGPGMPSLDTDGPGVQMAPLLVGTEVERSTLLSAPLSSGQGAWGFGFADLIGHRSGAVPTPEASVAALEGEPGTRACQGAALWSWGS